MNKGDYIGIKVRSNLMEPNFVIGDVVILDKNVTPKSGEYGGFILKGECYVCKYKEKRGKKYLLFKETKIRIKGIDYFEVLGKVKYKYFKV